MNLKYLGRSKKLRRALTPPIEGAAPQTVGEVDKVLPTGGVVMHFDLVYTLGEKANGEDGEEHTKGETITKRVGAIVNACNLITA
jgi:hypothetical protein